LFSPIQQVVDLCWWCDAHGLLQVDVLHSLSAACHPLQHINHLILTWWWWDGCFGAFAGTVDCEYLRWVEFLCHDISVHVPHHVCSKIPWYNLRAANESLTQNWGQYMTSCTINWRMMKNIFTGQSRRSPAKHDLWVGRIE